MYNQGVAKKVADILKGRPDDALLRLSKVARYLDTSNATLKRLVKSGDLDGVELGQEIRIRVASVRDYINRHSV